MPKTDAVLDPIPHTFNDHLKAQKRHKSPPLCTNTVQVPSSKLNKHVINELCKIEVISWLTENGYRDSAYRIDSCATSFVHLKDAKGHEKYSRLHCGNDYCPVCGRNGSSAHKKRSYRAMDRLLWSKVLGYMVFTLPKEISRNMPDSKRLSDLSKKAWELVKKNFDTPGGMARVHLMGEEPENLHVHINVLFPIVSDTGKGEVPREVLDKIRSEWTEYVNKEFDLEYNTTNVFYKFAFQDGRKIHQVKYVLRPIVTPEKFLTLPDEDRKKVMALRGWHNTRWFGKLANSQYKEYLKSINIETEKHEDKDIATSKRCPICGEKFRFIDIVHESKINKMTMGLRQIDNDTLVDFSIYSFLLKENSA